MTDTLRSLLRAGTYARQSRGSDKSIADQTRANREAVDEQPGWQLVAEYADGTSASRFAQKPRDDWPRVLADIAAARLDVLVMWESSRGDRTPETWFSFLSLCRRQGVLIHIVTHERTYDLARPRDWRTLAEDGIDNAYESEKIALRVRRGQVSAAQAGRPSQGKTPYGYRRVYDPRTGELTGQEPDPETAPIVRRIIEDVAAGVPLMTIQQRLVAEQAPVVGERAWYRVRVRDIALNPAYAGIRVYAGRHYPGSWPPIVDPEVWRQAQQVLTDPARRHTRPGGQRHLLSYLMTAPCGAPTAVITTRAQPRYRCEGDGCVSTVQAPVDELVVGFVLARLERVDAYRELLDSSQAADDEATAAADAEVARLSALLDQWRQSAMQGQTTPESLAVIERGLTAQIDEARARSQRAPAVHPALRRLLEPGADVRARWAVMPLPARRDALRALVHLRLGPAAVPGRRTFEPARLGTSRWVGDPLTWADHWRLMPGAPGSQVPVPVA